MVNTNVQSGICGFVTDIEAASEDMQNVELKITSTCPKIKKISEKLKKVDAYNEIKEGFNGEIYKTAQSELNGMCSSCVVPNSIIKSMQVAAMLALPKDISIKISK